MVTRAQGELMVTLKEQERPAGDVPPELLDQGHRVWRDPAAFAGWCEREGVAGIRETSGGDYPTTRWSRFNRGRLAWAKLHQITGQTGLIADHVAPAALGIPVANSLDRARALSETRAACR